jgi:hypothetical protein
MNPRRLAAAAFVTALLATAASCSNPVEPRGDRPPPASTPENAVRRLAWAWTHRDTTMLHGLLAWNYFFATVRPIDENSIEFMIFDRASDLSATTRLLVTGHGARPAAASVTFDIDSLRRSDLSGDRLGQADYGAHLSIRMQSPDFESQGASWYFTLVRGDSTLWPPGVPHGPGPDSTRWFVRGWGEFFDEPSAVPDTAHSLGALKSLYEQSPPTVSAPEWARTLARRRPAR